MSNKFSKSKKLIAGSVILFLFSAILFLSILLEIFRKGPAPAIQSGLINFLGFVLFSVYGYSSLLIPVFLVLTGVFLLDSNFSKEKRNCFFASVIPFFTIYGTERLCRHAVSGDVGAVAASKGVGIIAFGLIIAFVECFIVFVFSSKSAREKVLPFLKKYTGIAFEKSVIFVNEQRQKVSDSVERVKQAQVERSLAEEEEEARFQAEEDERNFDKNIQDLSDELEDSVVVAVVDDDEGDAIAQMYVPSEDEIENEQLEESVERSIDEALSSMDGTFGGFGDSGVFTSEPQLVETDSDYESQSFVMQNVRESMEDSILEEPDVPSEEEASAEYVFTPSDRTQQLPTLGDVFDRMDSDARDAVASRFETVSGDIEEADDSYDEFSEEESVQNDEEAMLSEAAGEVSYVQDPDYYDYSYVSTDGMRDVVSDEDEVEDFENQAGIEEPDDIQDHSEKPFFTDVDSFSLSEGESEEDSYEDYSVSDGVKVGDDSVFEDSFDRVPEADASVEPSLESIPLSSDRVPLSPRELVEKRNKSYDVSVDLLTAYNATPYWIVDEGTTRAADNLKRTLSEFGIDAEVTGIVKGPVVTMFEILPAPGVKLSKIVGLQDNIALRLAASSVRIVAPIPGKQAVGIEIPNKKRAIVSLRECIEQDLPEWDKMAVPVVLGKDIEGETQIVDLAKTPHLLIAGSTGSGKSVCVNSMILSILYKRSPDRVKMILVDPKIVELKLYNDIPHLLTPVITEPKKALQALQYCICEMERRYSLLDRMGVRDISSYNKRIVEQRIAAEKLPYLVVVIDEFADLMIVTGKQLESTIARLAAKSRAAGIHLVLATQRPSVDVVTGLIKANIPSRIAFMVASKMDSKIILDQMGAEMLLGKGDMLYASSTNPFPSRIQGTFVSDEEVENVVAAVKQWGEPEYIDDEIFVPGDDDDDGEEGGAYAGDGEDPLYDKALEIVVQAGKASASYLQRRLSIGYNRAARLVEDMEARGIVGPANGSKPRELIHIP